MAKLRPILWMFVAAVAMLVINHVLFWACSFWGNK